MTVIHKRVIKYLYMYITCMYMYITMKMLQIKSGLDKLFQIGDFFYATN